MFAKGVLGQKLMLFGKGGEGEGVIGKSLGTPGVEDKRFHDNISYS